jgi:hypothetical protein
MRFVARLEEFVFEFTSFPRLFLRLRLAEGELLQTGGFDNANKLAFAVAMATGEEGSNQWGGKLVGVTMLGTEITHLFHLMTPSQEYCILPREELDRVYEGAPREVKESAGGRTEKTQEEFCAFYPAHPVCNPTQTEGLFPIDLED